MYAMLGRVCDCVHIGRCDFVCGGVGEGKMGGSPHLAGGSEQNLRSVMLNLQSLSQRLKQAGEVFQKSVAIQQLLYFICAKQVIKD